MRVLIPAYFYPAGDGLKHWDRMIESAGSAEIVAIVNLASGPGKKAVSDPNYWAVLNRAKQAGITLIGYVSTRYGKRDLGEVVSDVDAWHRIYPQVTGFFFDEQASDEASVDYYLTTARHARRRLPKALVVNNPGTTFARDYLDRSAADVFCVAEAGKDFAVKLPGWAKEGDARRMAVLAYDVRTAGRMREIIEAAVKKGVAYVFVTDGGLPNPWDRMPEWWGEELKAVREANAAPAER